MAMDVFECSDLPAFAAIILQCEGDIIIRTVEAGITWRFLVEKAIKLRIVVFW